MSRPAFCLFDTAVGRCAIVWRGQTVVGAALPSPTEAEIRASLSRRFPNLDEADPPPPVAAAIALVVRLLGGEDVDLGEIEVDLSSCEPFERKVYAAARAIPRGAVVTYGELASKLGQPGASRAVGAALGRNPVPIIVPCHRILATGGRSGGFSAPGGTGTKFRILAIENARREGDPTLFDSLPMAVKPV